ncbi:hypothetical protein [Stetteria hydrogenophila]
MRAPLVDVEYCAQLAYETMVGLRVRVVGVQRLAAEEGAPGGDGPLLVLVKSLNSSIDELPVMASIIEAARGLPGGVEIYEYEKLGGEGDRYAKLARLVRGAIERGRPFIALVPQLMTVRLLQGLSPGVAEALEASATAVVEVEKEDLLYLPRYSRSGHIELVAKESSASSPERARFLERLAAERGLRVSGVKRLPDNSGILEYVLEGGLCTALERVPVTRLARLLYSTFNCTGLSSLVEDVLTGGSPHDRSLLTIYFYAAPSHVVDHALDRLTDVAGLGWVRVGDLLSGVSRWLIEPVKAELARDVARILERWWCKGSTRAGPSRPA